VPGDYNLEFPQQIEDSRTLGWAGTCNELNAADAAHGCARISGLGAVVVTNGVGALSAINGIAGAYSEHVPVIRVCGSLPLRARDQDRLMRHTLANGGGGDEFIRAYPQVTAAQARITPQNAVAETDRVIRTAWQLKLPVYLELPSDVAYLDIEAPAEPLRPTAPLSDPDTTSGYFSDNLPANTIQARGHSVDVGGTNYQAVTLKELIQAAINDVTPHPGPAASPRVAEAVAAAASSAATAAGPAAPAAPGPLTQAELWQTVQGYVRAGDVIITEDGTSNVGGWSLDLPTGATFITQAVWGSIGYSVGSLLGTLFAAPARRQLLVVGDGSFQLTAQELSTILRHDLKPVILLLNNSGYPIERAILGRSARYNDVADWAYCELRPRLRNPGTAGPPRRPAPTGAVNADW
jgi:TPP-dependent 2-oxoacid decarboxylase